MGFDYLGRNCKISDRAIFYRTGKIQLHDNVTIKDNCIISGGDNGISIDCNVIIEPCASIRGIGEIRIGVNAIISSCVHVISSSNDYKRGDHKGIYYDTINIERYSIIGHGSLILPGSYIGVYASIGAMSMVKNCVVKDYEIWAGVPAKKIGEVEQ